MSGRLLEVDGLRLELPAGRRTWVPILQGVSMGVGEGDALGLVGESGSGKSMTLRAITRLLPDGARTAGAIRFDGVDVGGMDSRALRGLRAHEIGLVHQDPRAHVNPLRTIGDHLTEGLRRVDGASRRDAEARAVSLLREVGIGDAEVRMAQYPHQLSGGLLQRVLIAGALLAAPRLLLADELTTALDVTTQEELMALLAEQRRERGAALLLVTHDLDLAAAVTDRTAVMYAGVVVEVAPSATLHDAARHPYTAGLLAARPDRTRARVPTIAGRPASASEAGSGCVFAARCAFVEERCRVERPRPVERGGHVVACHRAEELRGRLLPVPEVQA